MAKKLTIKYTIYKVKSIPNRYNVNCNVTYNRKQGQFLVKDVFRAFDKDIEAQEWLDDLVKNSHFERINFLINFEKDKDPNNFNVKGLADKLRKYERSIMYDILTKLLSKVNTTLHPFDHRSKMKFITDLEEKIAHYPEREFYFLDDIIYGLNLHIKENKKKTLPAIKPIKEILLLAIHWLAFEIKYWPSHSHGKYIRPRFPNSRINWYQVRPGHSQLIIDFSAFLEQKNPLSKLNNLIPELKELMFIIYGKKPIEPKKLVSGIEKIRKEFWR